MMYEIGLCVFHDSMAEEIVQGFPDRESAIKVAQERNNTEKRGKYHRWYWARVGEIEPKANCVYSTADLQGCLYVLVVTTADCETGYENQEVIGPFSSLNQAKIYKDWEIQEGLDEKRMLSVTVAYRALKKP